ncbi:unnamed protein product [Brassica napus]|uniref:(rape) hypothetical protein n=1 Tax=Brassica napus TaxID=3708 RepID=A0A816VSV2_BRANA|nr:unnamed protein product [Brassica napus]CAF2250525.1 unnamed protein product [Brassica napus]
MKKNRFSTHLTRSNGLKHMDKCLTINIDVTAMKELLRLTQTNEPLWIKTDGCLDVLSLKSYENAFPRLSSRGGKNHNLRVELFPSVVAASKTLGVVSSRLRGNHGDALHLTTT